MTLDLSINIGAIINASVLLIGFVGAFYGIRGSIDLLAQRLSAVEEAVKESRDIRSTIAIMGERLSNHGTMLSTAQRDISDLQRVHGH